MEFHFLLQVDCTCFSLCLEGSAPEHCWTLLISHITYSEPFLTMLYNAYLCQVQRFYQECLESFWLFPYISEVPEGNIPLNWNSGREINKGIVYKDVGGYRESESDDGGPRSNIRELLPSLDLNGAGGENSYLKLGGRGIIYRRGHLAVLWPSREDVRGIDIQIWLCRFHPVFC